MESSEGARREAIAGERVSLRVSRLAEHVSAAFPGREVASYPDASILQTAPPEPQKRNRKTSGTWETLGSEGKETKNR